MVHEMDQLPLDTGTEAKAEEALRAGIALLWRRKWLILAITAMLVSSVALWTYRQRPLYLASASLIVDQQMPQVLGNVQEVVDISPNAYRETQNYMETQVTVACSAAVLRGAAERLNLPRLDEFWPVERKGGYRGPRDLDAATALLSGMVGCSARRKASIIDVTVTHGSATLAAQLATSVAQAFIDHNMEHKLSATTSAMHWLAQRAEELKSKLEAAEAQLYAYRKEHDLISVTLEDRQSLQSDELRALSARLNEVRNERITLTAKVEQLKSLRLGEVAAVPALPILRAPLLQELKLTLFRARGVYRELGERYGDKHPKALAQLGRVRQAERDLRQEIDSLIVGTQRELSEARRSETMLRDAIGESKRDAFATNARMMQYFRLQRNAENARSVYQMLLSRMSEGDLTSKLRANNVRLLESATVPALPIYPRKRFNLLASLFFGLLLGVGLAFVLKLLDTRLTSTEDVQAAGLVYLGALPPVEGVEAGSEASLAPGARVRELVAQQFPMARAAEECRAIRTNLAFSSPDKRLKTLLVTSSGTGEGKTLFATNLALTTAQQGARVLLVDADMRRGRAHKVFGVPARDGLTQALMHGCERCGGECDADHLIKQTGHPNLSLLTRGVPAPNPAELCHSERFRRLLDALKERFDLIIFDSPPVAAVTDAVVLSTYVDGTVLVARAGLTAKGVLKEAQRRLVDVGAPLLGCVVNGLDAIGSRYTYRYASRYASDAEALTAETRRAP